MIVAYSRDIKKLCQVILVKDGVGIYGDGKTKGTYTEGCENVTGVCCEEGNLYIACNMVIFQLKPDGVGIAHVLQNGSPDFITNLHVQHMESHHSTSNLLILNHIK